MKRSHKDSILFFSVVIFLYWAITTQVPHTNDKQLITVANAGQITELNDCEVDNNNIPRCTLVPRPLSQSVVPNVKVGEDDQVFDVKMLHYLHGNVKLTITNVPCPSPKIGMGSLAKAYDTKTQELKVGCYAPSSYNDITLIMTDGDSTTVPANAFLLPQGKYEQEVPKVPTIPEAPKVFI